MFVKTEAGEKRQRHEPQLTFQVTAHCGWDEQDEQDGMNTATY